MDGDGVWKYLRRNHWSGEKWKHKSTEKNEGICKSLCGFVPIAAHTRKLVNATIS